MRDMEKGIKYFMGWRSKWDRWWVPELMLLKLNEKTLKIKTSLQESHNFDEGIHKKNKKSKSWTTPKGQVEVSSENGYGEEETHKKYRVGKYFETEEKFLTKQQVKIDISDELRILLLDDFYQITFMNKLVVLPAKHTVNSIMDDYLKYVKENNEDEELAYDLCLGLKEYFAVMLDNYPLLYPEEQIQLTQLTEKHKAEDTEADLNSTYGAPHLLRLFTKLGGCVTYTSLEPDDVVNLCMGVQHFLTFLEKNRNVYFTLDNYHPEDSPAQDTQEPVPENGLEETVTTMASQDQETINTDESQQEISTVCCCQETVAIISRH